MFTDYLGNEVHAGDVIAYPTASGSSSADLNMGRIMSIDPLVKDPRSSGLYCYESMRNKPNHATFHFPRRWVRDTITDEEVHVPDPEKAYAVKIQKIREGRQDYGRASWENPDRLFTIRNVDRIVVVTNLTAVR